MSEQRFDRIENQLNQIIEGMTAMQQNMAVMQQNMATKQDLALVQQTVSDIRTDISLLGERVNNLELTTGIGIHNSIRNQRSMINNINYELANQERSSDRLQSRVERLEDINRSNEGENPLADI
jgi:uncharacterized coiled-coil protein SlyX